MGLGNGLLKINLRRAFGSCCHVLWNGSESLNLDHTQGRGLQKDVYRGVGEPVEPLQGEGDDSCRIHALPRIRLVGRIIRHEPSSLSFLKGGVLDVLSHSLGALEKVV